MKNVIFILGFIFFSTIAYSQTISGEQNVTGNKEYTYTYTSNTAGASPYGSNLSITVAKGTLKSGVLGQVSLPNGKKSVTFKVKWNNVTTSGQINVTRQDDGSSKNYFVNITKEVVSGTVTISGQNITSNKTYSGNAVEIVNTTISSSATVDITGNQYVQIKPNFTASKGTRVAIKTGGTLKAVSSIEENIGITESDKPIIQQNIPNPFSSSSTTVSYFIPKVSRKASLHVFDLRGRLIDIIEINERGNGSIILENHKFNKNTIYLYSLIVDGNVIDTKRFYLQ